MTPARSARPQHGIGRCNQGTTPGFKPDQDLVPLAHLPVPDHAVHHERVSLGELLGGSPGCEDRHRAVALGIRERSEHEEIDTGMEVLVPGLVRRELRRCLREDVVSGLVNSTYFMAQASQAAGATHGLQSQRQELRMSEAG
jgi:hypothetical protein